jgi:hypothetical protein
MSSISHAGLPASTTGPFPFAPHLEPVVRPKTLCRARYRCLLFIAHGAGLFSVHLPVLGHPLTWEVACPCRRPASDVQPDQHAILGTTDRSLGLEILQQHGDPFVGVPESSSPARNPQPIIWGRSGAPPASPSAKLTIFKLTDPIQACEGQGEPVERFMSANVQLCSNQIPAQPRVPRGVFCRAILARIRSGDSRESLGALDPDFC